MRFIVVAFLFALPAVAAAQTGQSFYYPDGSRVTADPYSGRREYDGPTGTRVPLDTYAPPSMNYDLPTRSREPDLSRSYMPPRDPEPEHYDTIPRPQPYGADDDDDR